MFQKSSYSTQFCPDVKAVVSPPNPRGRHKTVVCLEMNKTSLDWHAEDKIDTDCFDKSSKILSSDASAFLLDNGLSAIRLLGSGTFSDVYLCITGNTSLKFAVKIIPKALTIHDDHNTSRLQRAMGNERCILNGLRKRQHPNLLFYTITLRMTTTLGWFLTMVRQRRPRFSHKETGQSRTGGGHVFGDI